MKVCIAEKPSVAQDIARILGARSGGPKQGYWEGNGWQITWTFGHLCELKSPEEYTDMWKPWAISRLPMIPEKFGISLKEDDGIKKQFDIIQRLYNEAECIVNCGDAGQEGELIQRWVMQKAGVGAMKDAQGNPKPVYRLWINSMTDDAIREGFAHLEAQQKYDKLYMAGLSRAIGDWLLGMNATRLYTVKYANGRRQVFSIGRVQTPTLAMIVKRTQEIQNFKPQPFWELKTLYRGVTFNATVGRYLKQEDAVAAMNAITDTQFEVTSVEKKSGKEAPKRLYDLSSLQVDCNRKYGFSADDTLKHMQSLYEKKVATYPRVDTQFLPDDVYPQCPGILMALKGYEPLLNMIAAQGKTLNKSKNVFDNSKVTDHHAIIPTNVPATNVALTIPERQVYDLIARRFISVFLPDCKYQTTTVIGHALTAEPIMCETEEGEELPLEFKATGKVITDPGWKIAYTSQGKNNSQAQNNTDGEGSLQDGQEAENEELNGTMPKFKKGEKGPHDPSIKEGQTKAPAAYNDASLIRAMETCGKQCDDEELRDAMKKNGIGRPSTRAAIIETLLKRNYIRREKKNIVATETGINIIGLIRDELLKSPELTGQWELKLRQIEEGTYDPHQFLEELKQMVRNLITEVTTIPDRCPQCGAPVLRGKAAWGCQNWRNCNWRLPF